MWKQMSEIRFIRYYGILFSNLLAQLELTPQKLQTLTLCSILGRQINFVALLATIFEGEKCAGYVGVQPNLLPCFMEFSFLYA